MHSSHCPANLGQIEVYIKEWLKGVGLPSPFGATPPCQALCWLSHSQAPAVNTQRRNSIVVEAQLSVLAGPGPDPRPGTFWLCDLGPPLIFLLSDWNVKHLEQCLCPSKH